MSRKAEITGKTLVATLSAVRLRCRVAALGVADGSALGEKASGVAGHPSVDELGRRGAVLDGKVFEGHFWIGQVAGQARLPRRRPPQLGVEAAVVDGFEEESQQVGEGQGEEQGQTVGLGLGRVPVAPPGGQQDPSIDGDEGVVDDAPAPGATLGHVEPAEVPNQADGGPVEPLPAGAVHEVRPLSPGPQHEDAPERQEVSGEVDAEDRGEESEGHHARRDE